jgi:hypothetical protein
MKKVHYRNIGFPKTGTNWLWIQLMDHPAVDCKLNSNFKEYRGNSLESYKKIYEKYDVSINLDVHAYDRILPENHYLSVEKIHEHTTHITMILRNPYEVINSMYNMERNRNVNYDFTQAQHIENCYQTYSNTESIFNNWYKCKLPVKYMVYDDLVSNSENFFYDVCDYIGIKRRYKDIGIKFKTEIKSPLVFDNEEIIKYINTSISVIEDKLSRDLSHWKR